MFAPTTHALSAAAEADVMQGPLLAQVLAADPAVVPVALVDLLAQALRNGEGLLDGRGAWRCFVCFGVVHW